MPRRAGPPRGVQPGCRWVSYDPSQPPFRRRTGCAKRRCRPCRWTRYTERVGVYNRSCRCQGRGRTSTARSAEAPVNAPRWRSAFHATFIDNSFACRRGKGQHEAADRFTPTSDLLPLWRPWMFPEESRPCTRIRRRWTLARIQSFPKAYRVPFACRGGSLLHAHYQQWRLEVGLLRRGAAEMLGCCVQRVRNWEADKTRPRGGAAVELRQPMAAAKAPPEPR